MPKLINLIKHLLIARSIKFTREKKRDFSQSTQCIIFFFHQHLGQINYLPSIKGAIMFQPPSYANESTHGWERK